MSNKYKSGDVVKLRTEESMVSEYGTADTMGALFNDKLSTYITRRELLHTGTHVTIDKIYRSGFSIHKYSYCLLPFELIEGHYDITQFRNTKILATM